MANSLLRNIGALTSGTELPYTDANSSIINAGILKDFGVATGAGTAKYDYGSGTLTSQGAFDPLAQKFGQYAGSALDTGAPQGLLDLQGQYSGTSPISGTAGNLFQNFASQLSNYNVDQSAATTLDRLNAMALPAEQNASNSLANRLFARGRLGANDTASGRAFGELATQQDIAQMNRVQTAYDLANKNATMLGNQANTFGGLASTVQSANLSDFLKTFAAPQLFQQGQLNMANTATSAGVGALQPGQVALQDLFSGIQQKQGSLSDIQRQIAAISAAKNAADAGGKTQQIISGAMTGAQEGFQAGGPWGALAGAVVGGGAGYYDANMQKKAAAAGATPQPGIMDSWNNMTSGASNPFGGLFGGGQKSTFEQGYNAPSLSAADIFG